MVEEKDIDDEKFFVCDECHFLYKEKEWAEKCEKLCKETNSCNLEITSHGQPPKD